MLGSLAVAVILLDNLIHKRGEGIVGIVRASIDTDTRVSVLGSRKDSGFERESS